MTKNTPPDLRLPALQIRQGKSRVIYSFAVDGKRLPEFTSISRIARDDRRLIQGYQRPEVLSHIAQIRQYVESEAPLLPNSIVVAFDQRVRFVPDRRQAASPYSSTGTIVIPLNGHGDAPKPGWIVDGQQRVAAIREARVKCFPISVVGFIADSCFPISVVGFIADSDDEQREQFILVNSTKPLPKGLLYELLPSTTARLPDLLQRRRFPARLLDLLNQQDDSPLRGLISTPTTPTGVIKDNSILKMLEHSLSDGVLFRFRDPDGDDVDSMFGILKNFWQAVQQTFKTAWGLPPNKSRLMHGAGVVSLGFLMDAIADRHRHLRIPPVDVFAADLLPLRDECRWTDGYWDFGPGAQPKWNEIQNTTRDIQVLSNHLLVRYKAWVWNRP
ncbi:MAG: DGQHR domain-containing protein [Pirellulaceae bacterium]|nr:DGQHR domain-containing protein [Pirellulaceae bacterium]